MKSMASVLRQRLAQPEILMVPGVYDPLSAKIAERTGFEAVGLGGYALGSHLCTTEPLIGLEELAQVCRYITAVLHIPLKVDAGAGFGEPLHVMRTIRELERAGVAAAHIEDQVYPKRAHYHKGIEHLISAEEMIDKIKAALQARSDPGFVIIARTDAMLTQGFAEGVRRANLYLEAGADVAFVFPNNVEEARLAPKEIHGPVAYLNSEAHRKGRPRFTAQELQEMGYKIASYALSSIMVTAQSVLELMQTIKATGASGLDQTRMKEVRQYIEDTIGLEEMYKIEGATVENR